MVDQPDDRRQEQAAEYVLGTLQGGEREAFEQLLAEDALLQQEVTEWEARLVGLNELTEPVPPPSSAWVRIVERLDADGRPPKPVTGWWQSLAVWRSLAVLALVALIVVSMPMFMPQLPSDQLPVYSLVLRDEQQQPQWVLVSDWRKRQLVMTRVAASEPAPDKAHELWLIPADERPPISLGLLQGNQIERQLPDRIEWQATKAFAVSLEPSGGSPTGQPTGPVLYLAKIPI